MNDTKYIGLDVHQATISATVLDSTGKLVMESILETKASGREPIHLWISPLAVVRRFLRRSGSRVSIHKRVRRSVCFGHRESLD